MRPRIGSNHLRMGKWAIIIIIIINNHNHKIVNGIQSTIILFWSYLMTSSINRELFERTPVFFPESWTSSFNVDNYLYSRSRLIKLFSLCPLPKKKLIKNVSGKKKKEKIYCIWQWFSITIYGMNVHSTISAIFYTVETTRTMFANSTPHKLKFNLYTPHTHPIVSGKLWMITIKRNDNNNNNNRSQNT